MRPVTQRFGACASASRTFSAIIDLLPVVRREVARLLVFFSMPCMLHLPLPACRDFVDCSSYYVLADKSSQDDDWFVEMARLVALRYDGESAVATGCLCDGTGPLYRLFSAA